MSEPVLDRVALALLDVLSPSGTLRSVAEKNDALDVLLGRLDADEAAIEKLREPSLVQRLEDDFARAVPGIEALAPGVEAWAIPLLQAVPGAPLVGVGVELAVKVALLALDAWSKKRLAQGR